MADATTSERSIVVPFLVSGVVGAGVALLLAPKAGRDLREDVSDLAAKAGERMSSAFEKSKERFETPSRSMLEATAEGTQALTEELEAAAGSSRVSDMILPLLAGSLAGAVIALMMAPKSGSELRNDVARIASDTKNRIWTKGKSVYEETTKQAA